MATEIPLTDDERDFIHAQDMQGVLGITTPHSGDPALEAVRPLAENIRLLGVVTEEDALVRARDCINIVRAAILDSDATAAQNYAAVRDEVRQMRIMIDTLGKALGGPEVNQRTNRQRLARAMAVYHARGAGEDVWSPRFSFQVTGQGEAAIDSALAAINQLGGALDLLIQAYPAGAPVGRPPRTIQQKTLLRLATHFKTVTGSWPRHEGRRQPGRRVADRWRPFVRLALQGAKHDVQAPDSFFSRRDFAAVYDEIEQRFPVHETLAR